MVIRPQNYRDRTMSENYAPRPFSILRLSLMLLIAKTIICAEDSDGIRGISISRDKRQTQGEDGLHGHASVII